ncbi:hypothetical protein NPIL_370741 [Nephila pilipes]|uniref:Uncharacterized protein n=1 Tax=Nephila pilipes TaxID=299642 RepID=A0A8X6PPG1_NEPPI|nr:hypothetical protein NPIL_370741 [Nephila pilipes]
MKCDVACRIKMPGTYPRSICVYLSLLFSASSCLPLVIVLNRLRWPCAQHTRNPANFAEFFFKWPEWMATNWALVHPLVEF